VIRLLAFTLLAAGLALACPPASAQKKLPTAADVLGKLKEKRERAGVQRYKLEFVVTGFRDGKLVEDGHEAWEVFFDWKTGRFRQVGWKGWGGDSFEITEVYDGERIKTRFRDVTKDRKPVGNGAWKYGMLTGRPNSWVFQAHWWPVFFHRGAIAGLHDTFFPPHFGFEPDSEKFFVDGEVVRNGRKCISLKTETERDMQYEYLIDLSKDHAVAAFTYYRGGRTYYALDIDVVAAKQPGRWGLSGWTYTVLAGDVAPNRVYRVKVSEFEDDVKLGKDDPFDIVPPEGAKVGRSHYVLIQGTHDVKTVSFEYRVKNGKLVQVGGPPPTPELWLADNWRSVARPVIRAASWAGARRQVK
jgi:hypothetical protein